VTRKCNLKCTFCWHSELLEDQKFDLDFGLYKQIIDEAASIGVKSVNLNGLGEPLMAAQIFDMIDYAVSSSIEDVMFHTNGTNITVDRAKRLINSGLTQIIFSLDTPDAEMYESMRINANFAKVNRNVERFIQLRNEAGKSLPMVRVTMVLTDKTVNLVEQFNEKWKGLADVVTVQDLLFSADSNAGTELGFQGKENSYYSIDREQMLTDSSQFSDRTFRCPYLYQSLKIHNDGSIEACSPRQAPAVGDMERGIKDAWNGPEMRRLRALHEQGRWFDVPQCKSCDIPYIEMRKIGLKQIN
jgi:MoaA/NifB/PqqE/SkfB family radical SAM enzyme